MSTRRLVDVDITGRADGEVVAWDNTAGIHVYAAAGGGTAEAVAATANTLALRDASGRTQVADPAADGDAVNRGWANGAFQPASGQYAVNTVAASGATETLPATFPAHNVTMDVNCTFTFGAPTAGHTFILRLAGAFTPTFPASVVWDGGVAPTYATPSVYAFTTLDGGTSWIGSLVASGLA